MHSFTDSEGRTWEIKLTFGSIKQLKESSLSIDLLDLEGGEPPLITRFATDIELLINSIYVLVKTQAEKVGVSDEKFGLSLDGQAILQAHNAFYEELQYFFQNSGRTDRVKAIAAQKVMIEHAIKMADAKVSQIDPEREVEKIYGG